jgi:hypothetical protein
MIAGSLFWMFAVATLFDIVTGAHGLFCSGMLMMSPLARCLE